MIIEACIIKAASLAKFALAAAAAAAVVTVIVLRKEDIDEWFGAHGNSMASDPDLIAFLRQVHQERQDGLQRYQWGIANPKTGQIVASKSVEAKNIDEPLKDSIGSSEIALWRTT